MKVCYLCNTEKSLENFYSKGHNNHQTLCKSCKKRENTLTYRKLKYGGLIALMRLRIKLAREGLLLPPIKQAIKEAFKQWEEKTPRKF